MSFSSPALGHSFSEAAPARPWPRLRSRETETRLAPPPDLMAGRLPRTDDDRLPAANHAADGARPLNDDSGLGVVAERDGRGLPLAFSQAGQPW